MPSPFAEEEAGDQRSGDLSRIEQVAKAEAGFVPRSVQLLHSLCASLWKERSDLLCNRTLLALSTCPMHSPFRRKLTL